MNETIKILLQALGLLLLGLFLGIWWNEFSLAITATRNAKKHGTYDKQPDLNHRCTANCKRPLVKQNNGLYYCAWCDVEYRCKYIHRIGESCTLNNNCKYPNCELIQI